jgi:uncharacterized FAD-dependent dehydrogenase
MNKQFDLVLPPEIALNDAEFPAFLKQKFFLGNDPFTAIKLRQSIDARSRQIKVNVAGEIWINEPAPPLIQYSKDNEVRMTGKKAIVVGFGPAGMFAALRLLESGIQPIVLERGKDVRSRRRDLAAINKEHTVGEDSNYCFGEGGAGTYSDGKLYTRSTKRGDIRRILEIFVAHGAPENILYEAHPHIGTNKLPSIVAAIRETILNHGGEVHFNTRVSDFIVKDNQILSVHTLKGDKFTADAVILATGHSARDIYELLPRKGILVEAKPFAMGVRVEHAQEFVDSNRYHRSERGVLLPAASYSLVTQTLYNQVSKGVFSFCMCPGGFIVPSATAPGEVVVNGMSPSRRDSKFANSGIVVSVELADMEKYGKDYGPLKGLAMQKELEQKACQMAGGTQAAPAQLLADFVFKKTSKSLLETSYQPGLVSVDLASLFSNEMTERLRQGFIDFDKNMKGFVTNEAQIVGVESRTSSPVRIPRNNDNLAHVQIANLYPCGEGGGFAGGIVSAAMDGERVAQAIINKLVLS